MNTLSQAAQDVLTERARQVSVEGWTPEHDDEHDDSSMAKAAAAYAIASDGGLGGIVTRLWERTGWAWTWFKPKDKRSNLIRAAALILAEIERLDRAGKDGVTAAPALDVDALAQEIRRVDGSHSLGAGALAEALLPFIERTAGVNLGEGRKTK